MDIVILGQGNTFGMLDNVSGTLTYLIEFDQGTL
jgi:hypothetical protein